MKAVFFDRDGVINDNSKHYYVYRLDQWQFNHGIIEVMQKCVQAGYALFIVTNQGGISRGLYTKDEVADLHHAVFDPLKDKGVDFKEIAICPHHPLLENCLCRKPQSLMLEKLIARFNIDCAKSWFVGDSDKDCQAATSIGIRCLKVPSNSDIRTNVSIIWDTTD
ncbi:MAG TPA: HAD-IIIA family hydrolase [Salinivirgaceae bacterium]|nr:HAD-IIIA family hydrolase [Salinivirgaceae bacterium]